MNKTKMAKTKPEAFKKGKSGLDGSLIDHWISELYEGQKGLLARLTKAVVERALSAELTHHLGYAPGGAPAGDGGNCRNGSSAKTLLGEGGKVEMAVPQEVHYFCEHAQRTDDHAGARRGEPIGSGPVEATWRQTQGRGQRPGQFGSQPGDAALLCLGTFWRNQRWHLLFPPHLPPPPSPKTELRPDQ